MTTLNAGEGKVEELAKVVDLALGGVSLAFTTPSESDSDLVKRIRDLDTARAFAVTRAVLTALRTPSEEMVEAMRERVDLADWALKAAFTAAIDVLLTPKDPEQ